MPLCYGIIREYVSCLLWYSVVVNFILCVGQNIVLGCITVLSECSHSVNTFQSLFQQFIYLSFALTATKLLKK